MLYETKRIFRILSDSPYAPYAKKKPDWWKCLCCSNLHPRCLLVKNVCVLFMDNGEALEENQHHILRRLKQKVGIRKLSEVRNMP